jgi:tetratricopeptide (TPR) repeat protein
MCFADGRPDRGYAMSFSHPVRALRPLEAYQALSRFAGRRGDVTFRLAMHAAVPQSFRTDLLHLLKLNFVPEAADDSAVEADVLLASFTDDIGGGYFQFDPEVRRLLLDYLGDTYADEPELRIRRVADFLLEYVEHVERRSPTVNDRLGRDFLETQRWVGLAFTRPEEAAKQLAAALKAAEDEPALGAHLHLGGLAHAVAIPLAQHRDLLDYAIGLHALESGEHQAAFDLLEPLSERDITVAGVTLHPARILRDQHIVEKSQLNDEVILSSLGEEVEITLFAANGCRPGQTFLFQVLVHSPEDKSTAHTMATAADQTIVRHAARTLAVRLRRGEQVDLASEALGCEVDDPRQAVTWLGQPEAVQFFVSIPAKQETSIPVRISAARAGIPIGTLNFMIQVESQGQEAQPIETRDDKIERFSRAFLSYASSDRVSVLRYAQSLHLVGIEVFHDVLQLEPGERWEKNLYFEIDNCDLFLLFWSDAARRSEWVVKEAEYALHCRERNHGERPQIKPIILEGPPIPKIPPSLRSINFHDIFRLSDTQAKSMEYQTQTGEAAGTEEQPPWAEDPAVTPSSGSKICLSYRQSDTPGTAGRIFDRLAQHYGQENVFMDVDSIPAGIDFYDHIQEALNGCSVLLAIIGPRWTGQRRGKSPRIMDETDRVFLEVATALRRKIPVVPILVDGVAMPAREKLPEALQALLSRNAVPVDSGRDFHPHMDRVIRSLDRLLPTTVSNARGRDHTDHVGPKPETASSHVTQGDAHHRRGDVDQAIAAYSEAIRLNPTLALVYKKRGDAYEDKDDFDQAIKDYSEAIRLNPKLALAYNNRGYAHYRNGDLDQAIADYSEAIRIDPNEPLAYENRGDAYEDKDELDRAIADYSEAIRLHPKYVIAYNNRGYAYYRKGDLDQAIADYSRAIRFNPKLALAYQNRGDAHEDKDDLNQALADYEAALAIEPENSDAIAGRDRVHAARSRLASGPYNRPTLGPGAKGNLVKEIQRNVGGAADGVFGPGTEAAVKQFQRDRGLLADGIVGPSTWAAFEPEKESQRRSTRPPPSGAERDNVSPEERLRALKRSRAWSWIMLRRGCLDQLGRPVSHSTPAVRGSSHSFARKAVESTGKDPEWILTFLDEHRLGLEAGEGVEVANFRKPAASGDREGQPPNSNLQIYVSYAYADNQPPPEAPDGGFVSYLCMQLRWELSQLGIPYSTVWPKDIFDQKFIGDEIRAMPKPNVLVVVLSRNWLRSERSSVELDTFVKHWSAEGEHNRRIIVVGKENINQEQLPSLLQDKVIYNFFTTGGPVGTHTEQADFDRGKALNYEHYFKALRGMALDIFRLYEIDRPHTAAEPS